MKRYLKIITSVFVCCIPVGLITYFAVPWVKYPTISAAGSSSLQPLVTEFSDIWESDTDLIVQGGGSGFGMKSIATSSKDIGMASKNTFSSVQKATIERNAYDWQTWNTKAIKTFTIGWDSIAIVYKSKDDVPMKIDASNFIKIYDLFSGNRKYRVNEIIEGSTDTSYFIPYSRTGGANASGTCTSFMYESLFDWDKSYPGYSIEELDEIENAIKTGNYLNNNVQVTNESNVETWNKMKQENYDGSITYLSMSFALQNIDVLRSSGYNIAWVYGIDPVEYSNENNGLDLNFLQEYKWFSPFNLMISLNEANKYTKDFIEWVYTDKKALEAFNNQKLVPVYQVDANGEVSENSIRFFKAMLTDDTDFNFKNNFSAAFNIVNSDTRLQGEKGTSTPNKQYFNESYGIAKEVILSNQNHN